MRRAFLCFVASVALFFAAARPPAFAHLVRRAAAVDHVRSAQACDAPSARPARVERPTSPERAAFVFATTAPASVAPHTFVLAPAWRVKSWAPPPKTQAELMVFLN